MDNFVCNVLSEKYPFMNEPQTVKQIEKVVEIQVTKSDALDKAAKDYHLWRVLAFDRSFPQKNEDHWDYCNQEAITRKALEMYKDRPSDEDITNVLKE